MSATAPQPNPSHFRLSLALFVFFASLLSACGDNDANKPNLTLRIIYSLGGLGDRSFADSVYRGVREAGTTVDIFRYDAMPNTIDEAEIIFHQWQEEPADSPEILLTVGQLYTSFLAKTACSEGDPSRYTLHLDDTLPFCENRKSVGYRTFAPSFQAGVAAVSMSEGGKVALIGGMNLPTVNTFIDGFVKGAEHAGGEIVEILYLSEDATGFNDAEQAKEQAARLFSKATTIFPVAGGSSIGVIEAAKECKNNCYVIGVDTDQSYLGRGVILGSVVKHLDKTVERLLVRAAMHDWEAGHECLGLEEGATAFLLNKHFARALSEIVEAAKDEAIEAEAAYLAEEASL